MGSGDAETTMAFDGVAPSAAGGLLEGGGRAIPDSDPAPSRASLKPATEGERERVVSSNR